MTLPTGAEVTKSSASSACTIRWTVDFGGLMRHATSEFTKLSRFLPSLYNAEQRETEAVPDSW